MIKPRYITQGYITSMLILYRRYLSDLVAILHNNQYFDAVRKAARCRGLYNELINVGIDYGIVYKWAGDIPISVEDWGELARDLNF